MAIRGSRNGVFYISCLPPARVTVAHVPMVCGRLCQPLPAVPTLWARPRAVIELGGERLPHRSPLGVEWAVAGPATKVRSSARASNSAKLGLILMT